MEDQNPAKENPQVPTQPNIEPKTSVLNSKWLKVSIAGFILLVALGGVYFLGKNSTPKTQTTPQTGAKPTPILTPNTTEKGEITNSKTPGWKKYTSYSYYYSFEFPAEGNFKENSNNVSYIKADQKGNIGQDLENALSIFVYHGDLNGQSLQSLVNSRIQESKANETAAISASPQQITFGGLSGLRYSGKGLGVFDYIYVSPQKGVYLQIISGTGGSTDENLKKLSDQILSTFKFTDQTSPTPTCKPRPACLDATPRCMIPETSDMCLKLPTLKIPEYGVQIALSDEIKDAYYINTTAVKGYVYLKVHSLDSEPQCLKDDSSTAALSRVGKDDINPMSGEKYSASSKGTTIGNNFYYIDLAQYVCAETSEGKAKLDKARTAFTNAEITQ